MGKQIAMMAKLVLLAAVLSAVALAAPTTSFVETDTVVPEEMVQTNSASDSSVALLKKQFADLQTEIQDGSVKTAAVQVVINKMIDMVDNQVNTAIKQAHLIRGPLRHLTGSLSNTTKCTRKRGMCLTTSWPPLREILTATMLLLRSGAMQPLHFSMPLRSMR